MNNMKIRIESPTHCHYMQDALFSAGYSWSTTGPKERLEACGNEAAWIFAYDDGRLTWDHGAEYGEDHPNDEYIWTPQKCFVKRSEYYKQPETRADKMEQGILNKYLPHGNYSQVLFTTEGAVERKFNIGQLTYDIQLISKEEHQRLRKMDILRAMLKKLEQKEDVPDEWHEELNQLMWERQNSKQFIKEKN
jgi:hypothetical protein